MSLLPGTMIGRYQIRAAIGAGGMGAVYLAHDAKLDRPVALKILPAEFTRDEKRLRRFEQEARVVSKISHPNVAHIYEVGESNGLHFMAMEYVEGETLRQRSTHKRFSLDEALDLGMQVAGALTAAAAAGVVHRDIKPENIMLRRDGYVKVVDFGLAKLTERWPERSSQGAAPAFVNTDPGAVMGTVNYMSPEQARGLEVDARTDLWSLGVVLYEVIAGRAPFDGPTAGDIIVSILEREPPPLARFVIALSAYRAWQLLPELEREFPPVAYYFWGLGAWALLHLVYLVWYFGLRRDERAIRGVVREVYRVEYDQA